MTDPLDTIEATLAAIPPHDRTDTAGLALVSVVFGEVDLDEDACHAATRRGLLLAAAAGNPAAALVAGSRAVLECAADLDEQTTSQLLQGLVALAQRCAATGRPMTADAARALATRRVDAVETLALLLLAAELDDD
jgi:hypothetical protein